MALDFDLSKRDIIDKTHGVDVYRYNLAENYALLSGDSAVVRRFYQLEAAKLGANDIFKWHEHSRSFFFNAREKNAFVYAGLTPWVVESIVRLVAASGFKVTCKLTETEEGEFAEAYTKDTNTYLQSVVDKLEMQNKYERGVYLESGLGDFAYRLSYDPDVSNDPILDVIEPQYINVKYKRGKIKKIIIKETTDDLDFSETKLKQTVEVHEIYTKEKGKILLEYKFYIKDAEITKENNPTLYAECKKYWNIDEVKIELPFEDFPIIFKKNYKKSELYNQERGVPDIQGLASIEDALSESISNLVDTIRKSAPKTFIDDQMLPTDIRGTVTEYSAFDHEYLIVQNSGMDPSKMLVTTQGKIDYQSHVETAKFLISLAINKAGLSPTTLGVTGLESINSAAESQDAREKPSLRTRQEKLKGWAEVIKEVLDKYFQYVDYINNKPIGSYRDMLEVTFNDYISPSTENVVDVIGRAVAGQVYSVETAVERRFMQEGKDYTLDDIIIESARIKRITPEEEIQQLGLMTDGQKATPNDGTLNTENTEGEEPSVVKNKEESTGTLNEEE